MALNSDTALFLDQIGFNNWEVPPEIDRFGGYQKWVVHDFPGGVREVQKFGYFPPDLIRWSGYFNLDPELGSINDRISALETMTQLGNSVVLSFSRFAYDVVIKDLILKPQLDIWIPYTIELIPVRDQNLGVGPPTAPPVSVQQATKIANQMGDIPGTPLLAPQIPNPQVAYAATTPGPSILVPGPAPNIPTPIPAGITADLTDFQKDLFKALNNAPMGNIANIPAPEKTALTNQIKNLNLDLDELTATFPTDTGYGAFSSSTGANLDLINNQINPSTGLLTQLRQVNPNLPSIAQQYYGDSQLWPVIAKANKDSLGRVLLTPNPRGEFLLDIPAVNN